MNIGIYSGSFNPPHIGHAIMASYVAQCSAVSEVWMLLTPDNPLKQHPQGTPPEQERMEMLRLLTSGFPQKLTASGFELTLPRPNYTANTLRLLSEHYPDHSFRLIIGADNWLIFKQWRESEYIIENHGLLIYPRHGCSVDIATLPANVTYLETAPQIEVSSTMVREAIARGENQNFFLPQPIWEYIRKRGLYFSPTQ